MKKIIYAMLFAMVLLTGCAGEKKESKEQAAAQDAIASFVDAINKASEEIKSSPTLMDPQAAMSKAVTPQVLRELTMNRNYQVTDKERERMQEAMNTFFGAVIAQYDTVPGSEEMKGLLNHMKETIDSRIQTTKTIGDIVNNQ